jgi:hypothetical protein
MPLTYDTSGGTEVRESEDQEAIPGEKEETDGALRRDSSPDIAQAAGRTAPTIPDPLGTTRDRLITGPSGNGGTISTTDATPPPKPKKKSRKPRMDSRPGKWEGCLRERRPPRTVTRQQGEM